MEIKTGYLYHIKDEFFDLINDENLMTNHERGKKRPTYFTIKDGDILWFIPLSTKVDKYQKIIDKKILKYGECKNIIIGEIFHERIAILIQNAFSTIEKYIDHVHVFAGEPARVSNELKDEILKCFKHLMRLKKYGKNLFFVDIDRIEKMMREELEDKIKN